MLIKSRLCLLCYVVGILMPTYTYADEINNVYKDEDQTLGPQQAYSLKTAIIDVYKNNPELKAAQSSLHASYVEKGRAKTEFLPDIRLQTSFNKNRSTTPDVYNSPLYTKNLRTSQVVVTQPLFNGWASVARIERNKEVYGASKNQYKNTEDSVLINAINAYEAVMYYREVYDFNIKSEQSITEYFELTKTRFDLEATTMIDVKQVEARLASARASRIKAYTDLLRAEANFEHIIGQKPYDITDFSVEKIPMPGTFEDFLTLVLQQNSSIIASEHNYRASKKEINIAQAQMAPSVSLQVAYINSDQKISSQKSDGYNAAIQVSVPLFQSGAEYIDIERSISKKDESKYSLQEVKNQVRENAITLWEEYIMLEAVLESTKYALEASQDAYEGAIEAAKAGERTSLEVLDAEVQVFSSRIQHRNAVSQYKLAKFQLHQLMGDLSNKDILDKIEDLPGKL